LCSAGRKDGETMAGSKQEAADLLNMMQPKTRMYLLAASLPTASSPCPDL